MLSDRENLTVNFYLVVSNGNKQIPIGYHVSPIRTGRIVSEYGFAVALTSADAIGSRAGAIQRTIKARFRLIHRMKLSKELLLFYSATLQ